MRKADCPCLAALRAAAYLMLIKTKPTETSMTVTLDQIKTEQSRLSALIAAFEQLPAPYLPEGVTLSSDERYLCSITRPNGETCHIILLPTDFAADNWANQMERAKAAGGDLPSRVEQALLLECVHEEFKEEAYWSNTQHSDDSDYAWFQSFSYGTQSTSRRASSSERVPSADQLFSHLSIHFSDHLLEKIMLNPPKAQPVPKNEICRINTGMLAALKAVAGEVTDYVRPYDTDSFLPSHIREQVFASIKSAEASLIQEEHIITTYTVNVIPDRVVATDVAINIFLMLNPDGTVDDALDAIFRLGVQAIISNEDEGTPV
jgi:hypothetical protein